MTGIIIVITIIYWLYYIMYCIYYLYICFVVLYLNTHLMHVVQKLALHNMSWFHWGSCRTTDPIHIVPSCLCAVLNGSSHSPTSLNGAPSTPNGFSNGPAMSSTASLSNQQLPPACGARQLCKLKRFLTTLQQFGNDISPEIGERVRSLVLGLVVSFGMHLFIYS